MANRKINQETEEKRLYNELKQLAKKANQRIVRIERYTGRKDAWAIRNLKEALEIEPLRAWTSKGRVAVRKSFDVTQLEATIKATKEFLKPYSTSTIKSIKKAEKGAVKTIKQKFSSEAKELTNEEAEALYMIFEDREVNRITAFIPRFRCNSNH